MTDAPSNSQGHEAHSPDCPKAKPLWLRHPFAECTCYADILNAQRERFGKTLDELFSRGPDLPPLHRRDQW
jgi:hypothetical protein